jgi:hypothetical protein
VIQWNGVALTTTYVSATQVTAQVPASDLSTLGLINVTVTTPSPGGGTSGAVAFTVQDPVPVLSSISPTNGPADSASVALTAYGSDFVSNSVIQWNGIALTTTYVSATQVTAQVPASDLTALGSINVTVMNLSPGGGTSSAAAFTVEEPVPVLSSISPTGGLAGSASVALTAYGSGFVSNSVIQWNGVALTTTYVSATQVTAQVPASDLTGGSSATSVNISVINPAPNGGTSNPAQFFIVPRTTNVTSINLPVNALVWDSTHAKLYASLPSTDSNGNSVVAIDPVSATVGTPQAAGSGPDPLALSSDDSFLYVGLDSTGQVERFSLPGLTLDTSLNLTLPIDPDFGQQVALTLAVAPGQPHTVAAILGNYSWTGPNTGGTVLYDDATPRSNIVPYNAASDSALAWGADSSVLYGSDGDSTGHGLSVMSANASGLTLKTEYRGLAQTEYGRMHFDPTSGHIYMDGGWVVDPATGGTIGSFNTSPLVSYNSPLCAPDLQNGVVFFLGQTMEQFDTGSGVTIQVFDAKTYNLLATLPVPEATGYPVDFMRWGNAGLAFHTSTSSFYYQPKPGPVYLVDGAFVNSALPADLTSGTSLTSLLTLASISPQSAVAGSGDLTLTVAGTNLDSDAVVMWNGTALQTTVINGTQLQATVPLADLSTAGTAFVSIADTDSNLSTNTSLAFTILPANAGTTNMTAWNYASQDLAWDPQNSMLIVPVWSADPVYPNSILEIDPTNGSVTKMTFTTADPDMVRVTSDNNHLYVGFKVVNAVEELALPSLSAESNWTLGYDPFEGPYRAWEVEPAPGEPQTTAVTFSADGEAQPDTNGMAVYDSGVARANGTNRAIQFQNTQWSLTPATIYASEGFFELYAYGVDPSGLTLESETPFYNLTKSIGNIHFDAGTGYLYADGGQVFDPATNTVIGNFNASGMTLPDSSMNRVFILGQLASQVGTSSYTIQSFDETKYTLVGTITLNSLVGVPVAFVRWGANGLALVTYNQSAGTSTGPAGMLYVISDSTFVSANTAATNLRAARVQPFAQRKDVLRGLSVSGAPGSNAVGQR